MAEDVDGDGTMIPPAFHHFAPGQWINDPVGLYRTGGIWVLHDQRAIDAGAQEIGWGRATSTDLLHWSDQGVVIAPEPDEWIYSGCVVVDSPEPPRAFFTLHRPTGQIQSQGSATWREEWKRLPGVCIAGRSETRDPFVFRWHDEWRMILAQPPAWDAPFDRKSQLVMFKSDNLESWEELGPVGPQGCEGEMFETPLLRRVPVADQPMQDWPWLLVVGVVDRRAGAVCGTRAWFGHFDGTCFAAAGEAFALDGGPDFYAPAIWSGTEDALVILTGWTNSWAYARRLNSVGWSGGAHALPRRLTADRNEDGWTLRQWPAAMPTAALGERLEPGRHVVSERFLIDFEGVGVARLGDLTVTLSAGSITLERIAIEQGLADGTFAGSWTVNRPVGPVLWIIDGCVSELVGHDGSVWMSALSLRSIADELEISGTLAATLRVVS